MLFGIKTRGGVRLVGRKERTRRKPIAEMERTPEELTLFLNNGTSLLSAPIVAVGDVVGQFALLAEGDGMPIYAPLAGVVTAIEERADFSGAMQSAIVLRVDERAKREVAPLCGHEEAHTPDELMALLYDFGIVEHGEVTVPLHSHIQENRGRVEVLVVNGTECQPYLTATHRLALDMGRDLLAGVRVLSRILGAKKTIFATTSEQLTATERIERELRRSVGGTQLGSAMVTKTIPTRYPLWSDKVVIQATTRREVPPAGTAIDVGCLVVTLESVVALGECLRTGRPQTRRVVTVTGGAVVRPRNMWVPNGTSMLTLLEECDGLSDEPASTLAGGLMMGRRVTEITAPNQRAGLICLLQSELPKAQKRRTCLQCGSCMEACPMALAPIFIMRAMSRKQLERMYELHPQDCIGCGACESVCPSHIGLVDMMRLATQKLDEEVEGE